MVVKTPLFCLQKVKEITSHPQMNETKQFIVEWYGCSRTSVYLYGHI